MLRNYFKLAMKVLMRRKFYTGVNLFGIAFTLLILMLSSAMIDRQISRNAIDPGIGAPTLIESITMFPNPQESHLNDVARFFRISDDPRRKIHQRTRFALDELVKSFLIPILDSLDQLQIGGFLPACALLTR